LSIQVRDLQGDLITDYSSVCRNKQLEGIPSYEEGFARKNRWLADMLKKTKLPPKVAFIDLIPAGIIQYYPEYCIPFLREKRNEVLRLDCIYVTKELQGKSIGRALLRAMIKDAKKSGEFERVETSTFDAHSGYPQPKFLREAGFKRIPGGDEMELEYPLVKASDPSQQRPRRGTKSQPEKVEGERGVKIFDEPRCPFSTYFNESIIKVIHEIDPHVKTEKIDIWTYPQVAIQRGLDQPALYVNGQPIKEFFMNKEPFKEEIMKALSIDE
jgi:GNAT superfamily N-acetyltransferase